MSLQEIHLPLISDYVYYILTTYPIQVIITIQIDYKDVHIHFIKLYTNNSTRPNWHI